MERQSENLLNANTVSFSEIISGDSIYQVPIFQRDYSWKEENWDDLWLDISNSISSNIRHYMGSIVLIKKDKKFFEIIDGQQRITTLSIIALATIKIIDELIKNNIDRVNNEERKDILMRKFVGFKNPKTLMFSPKLKLNKINDPIFTSYLIQFHDIPNPSRESSSNRSLIEASNYFYNKIKEEYFQESSTDDLIDFIEFIGDNLQFIQITVVDELNAYLVFETLNDRGLPLTVTDLFKNYLFSKVDEEDQIHIKNKWDQILTYIPYKNFSNFLRYYWVSRNRLITEKELFKAIKRNIVSQNDVIKIISDLEKHAHIYNALSNPKDELWKNNRDINKGLFELQLFGIKQPFTLLLAAYEKFTEPEFAKVVKICSVISFRYSIISELKTNVLEQVYSRAANNIHKGISKSPSDVFKDVSDLYPNDEAFTNSFIFRSIKTSSKNKLVRYILYSIENFSTGRNLNFEDDSGTIEHILPENPRMEWNKFFVKDIQKEFIYRLGNYTILERSINNACENMTIDKKIIEFKKSKYEISKDFDYEEWNPSRLKHRQSKLAKIAKNVWKLNY